MTYTNHLPCTHPYCRICNPASGAEHRSARPLFEHEGEETQSIPLNFSTKPSHATEQRFPEQCAEFKSIMENMYNVHLDKNLDYSPMNIVATGIVGVVTRLWDKTARLMNLSGFDIRDGKFTGEKEAKNESIEDTLLDLANYAVIAAILRRGKWGK